MTVLSDTWCTPRELAEVLGQFDLDPASNARSHVRAWRSFALERGEDGLVGEWDRDDAVWINPPYSDVAPWVRRVAEHPGPWAMLVKLDPTTRWWAAAMATGCSWAPFRRRLAFEWMDDSKPRSQVANFPSALLWRRWVPPAALSSWIWPAVLPALRGDV